MGVRVKERNGRWWVYVDHRGQRVAKCVGRRDAANQVAAAIQIKISVGEWQPERAKGRPFDKHFTSWLDTEAAQHCKASTLAGYRTAYDKHLQPHFGSTDIAKIKRADVKTLMYRMLQHPYSRSYVASTLAPLSGMFNAAMEDGYVTANPAMRIMKRTRAGKVRKADFLTREEALRLLDVCQTHFPEHYPFVLFLARTGTRIGEAVEVYWDDLDLETGGAVIARNFVDGEVTTPKSGKSRRVDLSRRLTRALKRLRLSRKKEALRTGRGEVPVWVFTTRAGRRIDPDNFRRRVWPEVLKKAELRKIRIHDLRHTYASLLIQQGEGLTYVKEQLGHHSIRVTADTYAHLIPGGNRAAVDRLDDPEPGTNRNPRATGVNRKRRAAGESVEK